MKNSWMVAALAAALAAHVGLVVPQPLIQALSVWVIAGWVPGFLLVEVLVGQSDSPPDPLERLLYSTAAAMTTLVVVMLLLSYLPGGPTQLGTLLAFDAVTLFLALLWWLRRRVPAGKAGWPPLAGDRRWLWAGMAVLLVAGAVTRFVGLGYSDFQGDEARAALRAAAVLQGYEDVLMLHKKGPTEILLPTVFYTLSGHLNEQSARLPFAIANLAGLLALFVLGWRLHSALAGWIAALFLTFDGYFIGFAHIVQYQSVVFLTSVLAVLAIYRIYSRPVAPARYLALAALLLATGALSHYEGVLAALPAAFLLGATFWRHRTQWRPLLGAAAVGSATGALLVGIFYLPYVLHERFAATYLYLTARRIGGSPPYNNLADVFLRTTLYSTTYQILLQIGLTVTSTLHAIGNGVTRPLRFGLQALTLLLFGLTLWNPAWLTIGDKDWILVPFTLLFGLLLLLPRQRVEERMLWLWFGAVMVLALFLTEKPRTHVYTFFIPWALIGGSELARLWQHRRQHRAAPLLGSAAAAAAILVFGTYSYHYFLSQDEVLLDYFDKRPPGYWVPYTEPDNKARFGFPLANGWKTIGELYRQGILSGPYETNEKEAWVPAWYTRGEERCRRDAQWFFDIRNLESWSTEDALKMEHYLREGFEKWGLVEVNGRPKMVIYQRTGAHHEFPTQLPNTGLTTFPNELYAEAFDRHALADLPLTYPAVDPPVTYPLHANLGNQITLEGYDLHYETPLRAGDKIHLTLYWRAQQPIDRSYKVFNQSYFGNGQIVAQRDGYPVCEGRETWRWDPGELVADPYVIPIKPDAPDGLYPLYTGMYLEESFERLPVLDENGVEISTQVHLTDIRIGEE